MRMQRCLRQCFEISPHIDKLSSRMRFDPFSLQRARRGYMEASASKRRRLPGQASFLKKTPDSSFARSSSQDTSMCLPCVRRVARALMFARLIWQQRGIDRLSWEFRDRVSHNDKDVINCEKRNKELLNASSPLPTWLFLFAALAALGPQRRRWQLWPAPRLDWPIAPCRQH